jgi:hypothetical protein
MKRRFIARATRVRNLTTVACCLVCQLAGCSQVSEPLQQSAVPRAAEPQAASQMWAASPNAMVGEFTRHALNVLLLPLLDDEVPSRWADPSAWLECTDSRVTVDGQQLDVGSPVPGAFTVRWQMVGCVPFGQYLALTGEIELRVESIQNGYMAEMHPDGLTVESPAGSQTLTDAFVATLAMETGRPAK